MKKLFAGCIAVSFAAMLAACGDDSSSTSPETSGNESSSSVENVSSSSVILSGDSHGESGQSSSSEMPADTTCCKVTKKGFLWDGSFDNEGRVLTGSDDKTSGYWYEFNDLNDWLAVGASKFTYPPDIEEYCNGNWYESVNCFEFMMETYGGIKEKVTLGAGAENPYVGLGFNILNEEQEGTDVMEWGGLCLEYSSGLDFNVWLQAEDGTLTTDCQLVYRLGASDSVKTVDIPWSKFGSSCGFGVPMDATEVLANASAVHLRFDGKAGDSGEFLLKKIGSLGQCGSGSAPVSSSAVAPKSSSSSVVESSSSAKLIIGNMLWDGFSNRSEKVLTGGDETSGYWYEFNDNSEGGSSTIQFPSNVDTHIYGSPFPELIEKYRGLQLGVAFGSGYEKPYAGVAFNVWNEEQEGVNVSPWGGICLQYKSSIDFEIELGLEDGAIPTMGACSFVARVPASTSEKISDFGWEKFMNNCGAGVSPDIMDVLKKVATVKLKFKGDAGTTGEFLIERIGAVGMCHDMIPAGP